MWGGGQERQCVCRVTKGGCALGRDSFFINNLFMYTYISYHCNPQGVHLGRESWQPPHNQSGTGWKQSKGRLHEEKVLCSFYSTENITNAWGRGNNVKQCAQLCLGKMPSNCLFSMQNEAYFSGDCWYRSPGLRQLFCRLCEGKNENQKICL